MTVRGLMGSGRGLECASFTAAGGTRREPGDLPGLRKQGLELEEVGAAGKCGESPWEEGPSRDRSLGYLGRDPGHFAGVLSYPQARPQVCRKSLREAAADQILEQTRAADSLHSHQPGWEAVILGPLGQLV